MENTNRNFRSSIYAKDIANITGKSVKSAGRLIIKIKRDLGKDNHQILTINEFCKYMGLELKDILGSLNL
ncbi:MAG: hypothetical protein IPG48_07115 [Saprospiraceae bacterium]|nr:hypothetical protein [Saprospiraceae bacterium]MBK6665919.1 hypothetical protein [Saprospiraceae bacterium]MBK7701320.1 hypothetical protein [Saprospiraceae bacterium]MBK8828659.1 hypothetical protein [Saprospiraceae bacterium]